MERDKLHNEMRRLVRDVLRARFEGTPSVKFARAHGYADGYMRALLDAGLTDKDTLLELVAEERRSLDGDNAPRVSTQVALAQ